MQFRKVIFIILSFFLFITQAAADPVFHDAMGKRVQLSALKGSWVIANYWAAWCPGCIKEIPELNSFYNHYKNKNIVLYGINYDRLPIADLRSTIIQSGISFPVLEEDPDQAWRLGEIEILPTTIIINPNGDVVKTLVGPSSEEKLVEALKAVGANLE
jgi:thiol-disulfide isomerase/thioredoxin